MKIKNFLPIVAMLTVLALSCESIENPTEPGSSIEDISITNSQFSPAQKTVAVGTTVRWTNNDAIPHTVDSGFPMNPSDPPIFNLTFPGQNDTDRYTFNTAGNFPYHCGLHGEAGTITVQ